MKEMWDQRYAGEEYVYGTDPNPFFQEYLEGLKPGKLLLPAEGEGRHAVFAARFGWDVEAFDQSEEAWKKAIKLANQAGVEFRYQVMDIEEASYEPGSFDLIALLYLHLPEKVRFGFHRRLITWLKPGGTILLEGFSKDQLNFASGGPKDKSMLFDLQEIAEDFSSLQTVILEKKVLQIEAGTGHTGEASIVRFLGKK